MQTTTTSAIVKGCLTWFEPKPADAERLREALDALGKGDFAPKAETPEAALQHALQDYGTSLSKLRSAGSDAKHQFKVVSRLNRKQDGFELVDMELQKQANSYTCECACKVDEHGQIEVLSGYFPVMELQEAFDRYRATATGASVGRSLVELTRQLHGTCVRLGGGGVYYLPEDAVSEWHDVIDAFESCSGTRVNRMRVVMDDMAARAIKDGIVQELIKEAAEIAEELARGDLSEEAVERRKARSQELRAKAREYESILQDTLIEVHQVLDVADTCAAAAIAIQEDTAVFDAAFDSTFA